MKFDYKYKTDYTKFSDKQIVERILAGPHDDEAAVYLLHVRYAPLLYKLYSYSMKDDDLFDDYVDEVYISLKGKDCSWRVLANFEWRSTLGYWLKGVGLSTLREFTRHTSENKGRNVSLDDDTPGKPKVQVPSQGEENFDRILNKVMLMEAISKLEEDDLKLIVIKRMQGYKSKEIAELLQMKWEKYGIIKYNNDKEVVVPDAGYIDAHAHRARKILKKIMSN